MTTTTTRPSTQPPPRRRRTERIVHFVGIVGRVFVAAGLLLLFFTAYLLWGTGIYTKKAQQHAERVLVDKPVVDQSGLSKTNIPPARPDHEVPLGEPLFKLAIPRIALSVAVVEGVGKEQLKKGPGHFPVCSHAGAGRDCVNETKYPGERGNVAISGHRTTYGAPFYRVNEVQNGDIVDAVVGRARYRYRVRSQEIVDPTTGFQVVEQHGRRELTLTTCNPRFSAAQRLIIHADYVGASLISGPGKTASGGSAAAQAQPVVPADVIVLGIAALVSALASLGLSKRYRTAAAVMTLVIIGSAGLWVGVFPRIQSLLPSNF